MTTQYFLFTGQINDKTAIPLSSAVADAINDSSISELYFGIATVGGNVNEGIALHHIMRGCPKPITMHGIGNINSIGIAVFLGAKTRYAVAGTRFLFHEIGAQYNGQAISIPWLNRTLATMRADEVRITNIWRGSETNLEQPEASALFENENAHDCDWAMAHGFIREIRDFGIPMGARLRQIA